MSAIDWTAQQATERGMRALVLYPTWRIRMTGPAELDRFAGRSQPRQRLTRTTAAEQCSHPRVNEKQP
jgi:hypothetical protein